MKATEKTFNGLRISGFLALFLILALSGLSSFLDENGNDTMEQQIQTNYRQIGK